MRHITAGFPFKSQMLVLEESSKRHGFDFFNTMFAGNGDRLVFVDKFTAIQEFLTYLNVPDHALVMFTDAYDTAVVGGVAEIHREFIDLKADIVFNAEAYPWPPLNTQDKHYQSHLEMSKFFEQSPDRLRYLNSGCYIGYARAIRTLLSFCLELGDRWDDLDDQRLAQHFFVRAAERGVRVALDSNSRIFGTLGNSLLHYEYRRGSVYNRVCDSWPAVLHANANKDPMSALNFINAVQRVCPGGLSLVALKVDEGVLSYGDDGYRIADPDTGGIVVGMQLSPSTYALINHKGDKFLSFTPHDYRIDAANKLGGWEIVRKADDLHAANGKLSEFIPALSGGAQIVGVPLAAMTQWTADYQDRLLTLCR